MSKLIIDDNWQIETDEHNCTLLYSEEKTREKIDKDRKKTGETEQYLSQTPYYYPTIQACFRRYLAENQKEASTVQECIAITERVEALIKSKF